ncbi:cuticle protein 6-like [Anabrus simplex]|uniref:cuticle protein 6-like n=1 Tax=Anabrus simplex TaxID=316456 RepID=UPI0035A349C2
MNILIVLSAVVAISLAKPGYLAGGIAARLATPIAAPYYSTVVAAPAVVSEQHHAQDTLGQYRYGYSDGLSIKGEFRTADGVTRGAYAYVDSEGKVQNVAYTADAAGFRVSASNLPEAPAVPEAPELRAPEPVQDTAEVAAAKAAHEVAVKEAEAKAAAPAVVAAPSVYAAPAVGYSTYAAPTVGYSTYAAPAVGYSSYAAYRRQLLRYRSR